MASTNHSSNGWEEDNPSLNFKPMGPLGAPVCRWTPTLVAMIIALVGLIFLGIGAVMAGFVAHEEIPFYTGIALVIVGLLMMGAGAVIFIMDMKNPKVSARDQDSVSYQVGPEINPVHIPNPAARTGHSSPPGRRRQRQTQAPQNIANIGEAPPAYHDVVSNQNHQPVNNQNQPVRRDRAIVSGSIPTSNRTSQASSRNSDVETRTATPQGQVSRSPRTPVPASDPQPQPRIFAAISSEV